jgi:2-aminoadipate transaminase
MPWSFESGLPDPTTYPVDDLLRISEAVLRHDNVDALGYGDFHTMCFGHPGLRELVAERTRQRDGKKVDTSQVMLTFGTMHAVQLAREAFVEPGDVFGLEGPSYVQADPNAPTIVIPVDSEGMRIDILESELERLRRDGRRLRFFYTINDFHSPTGTCLSLSRRERLIELAGEFDFLIFQDAIYDAYRYEGEAIPTLGSLDYEGRVIRADSFSKVLAPGLRLASVTAAPQLIQAMGVVRGDMGTSNWMCRIVEQYLREGLLEAHLERVCALYRKKRDIVASALDEHCSPWVSFDKPEGGFFIWAQLSDDVDAEQMRINALNEGVSVRPGERFFNDGLAGQSFFRIAYSMEPLDKLEQGIAALGKAVSASLRGRDGQPGSRVTTG